MKNIFLFYETSLIFLVSLILTPNLYMHEKAIIKFALALIFLLFTSKNTISNMSLINKKVSKIFTIATQQPTQQSSSNTTSQDPQQQQHSVKQINPNHPHAFHFKKIPLHLKKDTHPYLNLWYQQSATHT